MFHCGDHIKSWWVLFLLVPIIQLAHFANCIFPWESTNFFFSHLSQQINWGIFKSAVVNDLLSWLHSFFPLAHFSFFYFPPLSLHSFIKFSMCYLIPLIRRHIFALIFISIFCALMTKSISHLLLHLLFKARAAEQHWGKLALLK